MWCIRTLGSELVRICENCIKEALEVKFLVRVVLTLGFLVYLFVRLELDCV